MTKRLTAGTVLKSDSQADIWEGSYRLVERVAGKPRTWVVENLPDPPETAGRIREFWSERKAKGWYSPDGEADREIADRAARVGERREVRFVSASEYARYF
jgi:hypothetical protein